MSTQGGKGANNNTNSSGISGWFFNNQSSSQGKNGGFSNGNSSSNGVGGSNNSYGNGFMSHTKDISDWQSGKHVNMWMPQTL